MRQPRSDVPLLRINGVDVAAAAATGGVIQAKLNAKGNISILK